MDVALSLAVGTTLVGGAIVGKGVDVGTSAVLAGSVVGETVGTEVGAVVWVAVGSVSFVVGILV